MHTTNGQRSYDERLEDLEIVVYGNERQRIKGLIDSLSEMRQSVTNDLTVITNRLAAIVEDVHALKDNRLFLLQMGVSLATLATSGFALYWALRHP